MCSNLYCSGYPVHRARQNGTYVWIESNSIGNQRFARAATDVKRDELSHGYTISSTINVYLPKDTSKHQVVEQGINTLPGQTELYPTWVREVELGQRWSFVKIAISVTLMQSWRIWLENEATGGMTRPVSYQLLPSSTRIFSCHARCIVRSK